MRKKSQNKLGNLPDEPGTDYQALGNEDPRTDEPIRDRDQDHPKPTVGQAEAFRRFPHTDPAKLGRRMAERSRRRTKNRTAAKSRKRNR